MPFDIAQATGGTTSVQIPTDSEQSKAAEAKKRLEIALSHAQRFKEKAPRRTGIPLRKGFVRVRTAEDVAPRTPLSDLVGRGGRGMTVALQLYLGLVWVSSDHPYESGVSSRTWAQLFKLEDPVDKGSRRVNRALKALKEHGLVEVISNRGLPSTVFLLHESGDGRPYKTPSAALREDGNNEEDLYFKVPVELWLEGKIQSLTAPGLAMLLVLLEAGAGIPRKDRALGRDTWWSTDKFPSSFKISSSMRSRGTKELLELDLLDIARKPVSKRSEFFAPEQVRKIYRLKNEALVFPKDSD